MGHVECMGDMRGIQILVRKQEGKKLLWRPRHIWEHNIKFQLNEIECKHVTGFGSK